MTSRVSVFSLMLLAAAACVPTSASSASWEDEAKEWEKFSGTRFYKDPGYAAKLALNLWPIDNGHFYVGEVRKGVWFSLGETVALAAAAIPILNAQARSKQDKDPIWTDGMVAAAAVGGASYLILKMWSAFDAAAGARRYNRLQEEERKKQQGSRWDFDGRRLTFSRRWGG